jgi:hypothetical protein
MISCLAGAQDRKPINLNAPKPLDGVNANNYGCSIDCNNTTKSFCIIKIENRHIPPP